MVGFDFGTASTKVVLRTPNYLGGRAFAVPFPQLEGLEYRYLLPSRLVRLGVDEWSLAAPDAEHADARVIPNIKGMLMELRPASEHGDPAELATVFLALALREVRRWFLEHHRNVYGTRRLAWSMNVGLPAAPHDDFHVRGCFKRVARAAWQASLEEAPVTCQMARKFLADPLEPSIPELHHLALVPEVGAEAVGYARSDRRQPGLHVLVDIGASTLDVCAFVLHERDEDQYSLLAAKVSHHGTIFLHRDRMEGLRAHAEAMDPLAPVPGDLMDALNSDPGVRLALKRAEDNFVKKAAQVVTRLVWFVRKVRDPNAANWTRGVPLFLCGGGRNVPAFKRLLDRVDTHLKTHVQGCPGIRARALPAPSLLNLHGGEQEYHRLAVAWGLSFDRFDIGDVSRPSEIEDFDGGARLREAAPAIDKEQV